jgi:hypothetical protein
MTDDDGDIVGLPGHWKVVDCAECGRTFLGESMRPCVVGIGLSPPDGWSVIGGLINGRPYCVGCLRIRRPIWMNGGPHHGAREGESNPWQENAVRELEGGRD